MNNQNEMNKKSGLWWKILLGILGFVLLVYAGISVFFHNHFYIYTSVNGLDFSGKTVETAGQLLTEEAKMYELLITGRDQVTEVIRGTDFSVSHDNSADLQDTIRDQHPLLWVSPLIDGHKTDVELRVSYDEEKLEQIIDGLECMKEDKQVAPTSAKPVYENGSYVIQAETVGMQIDKEALKNAIAECIATFETELDLDAGGCYVQPKYTKESEEVLKAKETADQWIASRISYSYAGEDVTVDADEIAKWIKISDEMKVSLKSSAVKKTVQSLSATYNTSGKKYSLKTPTGKKTTVTGGTYGTKVDEDKEYKKLVKEVKAGKIVSREPVFSQKIAGTTKKPWGKTFLEVDLTEQHMWYIKDGEVAFESDVVTGAPNPKRQTPQGLYSILEKMRNKVLRGDVLPSGRREYETPVAYWMRVTWTGIGFHDATWQRKFGGERYKQGYGSHGCINMPYNGIKELYDMVEKGCPVVMHY